MALDFISNKGIATSIGHAPGASLVDPVSGSKLAIAEALTNIIWSPLTHGLKGVSLSANWMWPSKNSGEDSRLYRAVEAVSNFAIHLGINIPTGKDSLSMTQKYPDGEVIYAPGTVIISAVRRGARHQENSFTSHSTAGRLKTYLYRFFGRQQKTWRQQLRANPKSAGR